MNRLFLSLSKHLFPFKCALDKRSSTLLSFRKMKAQKYGSKISQMGFMIGCSLLMVYSSNNRVFNTDKQQRQEQEVQESMKQTIDVAIQESIQQNEGKKNKQEELQKEKQEISEQLKKIIQKQQNKQFTEENKVKQEKMSQEKMQESDNSQKDKEIKKLAVLGTPKPNHAFITANCPPQIKQYLQKCQIHVQILPEQYSKTHPQLWITNKKNRTEAFRFTPSSSPSEAEDKEITYIKMSNAQKQINFSQMKILSNFLNPPHELHTYQQFIEMLRSMKQEYQFMIVTYIPNSGVQTKTNSFDTYTQGKVPDFAKLQQLFDDEKLLSGTNQVNYCIVRNYQLAQQIKIGNHKGDIHLIYQTTPNAGMETSTTIDGKKYTYKKIFNGPNNHTNHISYNKKLDYYTNLYLNEMNIEQDVQNFILKHSLTGDKRKILLVSSKQKREQFQSKLKQILRRVGKMLQDDVLVLYTDNEKALKKHFQVVPDDFATVRLIDLATTQVPLIAFPEHCSKYHNKFYSKKKFQGGFTVQNLCKFVKQSDKLEEFYETKKNLINLQSVVRPHQEDLDNTVVLHWKYGCKGCKLTVAYLQKIKQIMQAIEQGGSAGNQNIFKYEIEYPKLLRNIRFARYNILNEQPGQYNDQNHDLTPQLIYHRKLDQQNRIKKPIDIGTIIGEVSKINPQNEQQIHHKIVKQLIQAITFARLSIIKQKNDGALPVGFLEQQLN